MNERVDEMTHQDIWDDSALVSSWNEALAEYKKYHSIHATGGNLQDLLSENEQHAKPETQTHLDQRAESAHPPTAGEAEKAVDGQPMTTHEGTDRATTSKDQDRLDRNEDDVFVLNSATRGGMAQSQGMDHANASTLPPPQALLGSVQDEDLKRLLMSWYYAGFYTGLYEGQQKHRDQQRQPQQ